MRTFTLSCLPLCVALSLTGGLAGCGADAEVITVQGTQLTVAEQTYGFTGSGAVPYCKALTADGQYMVVISDFPLCSRIRANETNATIFHGDDTTHLRFIIPSSFLKNPNGTFKVNEFKIGPTNDCKQAVGGITGTAIFAHNDKMRGIYDVELVADSGVVKVTDFSTTAANIKGSYELKFGGDQITGLFDASFCPGLTADHGQ